MSSNPNVDYGDYVMLPARIKELIPVTVIWFQDTEALKAKICRKANYIACYGYIESAKDYRDGKEVLVFVADEMLADSYAFLDAHLSKRKESVDRRGNALPESQMRIRITGGWQYGELARDERFIVYHPKTRKPFSKRFTTAAAQTPGALNSLIVDAKNAMGVMISGLDPAVGIASVLGLSAAQTVITNLSELTTGTWGSSLEDFKN